MISCLAYTRKYAIFVGNCKKIMEEQIEKALEVLGSGGIILYPTETVWGLGCDATNAEAVRKIYDLKQREDNKAMIVLVREAGDVARYVRDVPEVAWQLLEVNDKPLTLILDEGCGVASNLLPPEKTIAIRVTSNEFCKALLRKFRRPLVSTSANISGEPTPKTFGDISQRVKDGVDFVVDSSYARGATGESSSIIKLSLSGEFKILR